MNLQEVVELLLAHESSSSLPGNASDRPDMPTAEETRWLDRIDRARLTVRGSRLNKTHGSQAGIIVNNNANLLIRAEGTRSHAADAWLEKVSLSSTEHLNSS